MTATMSPAGRHEARPSLEPPLSLMELYSTSSPFSARDARLIGKRQTIVQCPLFKSRALEHIQLFVLGDMKA